MCEEEFEGFYMEKEHTNSELEHEEPPTEAPSAGEILYTDTLDIIDKKPIDQQENDDHQTDGEAENQSESDEEHLNIPEVLPVLPLKDSASLPFTATI